MMTPSLARPRTKPLEPTVYTGTFIHTPTPDILEILEHKAIGVDNHGIIRFIEDCHAANADEEVAKVKNLMVSAGLVGSVDDLADFNKWNYVRGHNRGNDGQKWTEKGRGVGWWFPGFVDTHIHASQYPNTGIFGKTTLLSWLNTYTYPLESSLSALPLARRVYAACVSRTLTHGTTTAAYYATTHVPSTNLLAEICLSRGQRAFIGRVCMDTDISPAYYRDASPESAIADTEATIAHINTIDPTHELITPIITPRFAPSCSSHLLSALGALAAKDSLPIQTHISENTAEVALVTSLFPSYASYADVYDAHNLLTPKTVLAHAVHLSPTERRLVRNRGCSVSHCPVSNTSLSSGLCPVRELMEEGIEVGLGTDVSGGWSASVLVAAREAGMVSRTLAGLTAGGVRKGRGEVAGKTGEGELATGAVAGLKEAGNETRWGDGVKLSTEECLYLATRGGAKCLGLGRKVGAFEVGMAWDAQLVELDEAGELDEAQAMGIGKRGEKGLVDLWGSETWGEKVAKWLICGDDRNTKMVYVGGRLVHRRG